jgi:hypothetical protein
VKKAFTPPPLPEDWTVHTEWKSEGGRIIVAGTEISITDEPGRFRFIKAVTRPNGVQWIDVVGGKEGHTTFRSFHPSRIKRVHWKSVMRGST